MWGGARGAGQCDECFRALDLNAPVAAFAPLGRIGRVRAQPGVSLAALACPGLGAFAPLGRIGRVHAHHGGRGDVKNVFVRWIRTLLSLLLPRWGVSDGFARKTRGAARSARLPRAGSFCPVGAYIERWIGVH